MTYFEFLIVFLLCVIVIYLYKIFNTLRDSLYFTKTTVKFEKDTVTKEHYPYLSYIKNSLEK